MPGKNGKVGHEYSSTVHRVAAAASRWTRLQVRVAIAVAIAIAIVVAVVVIDAASQMLHNLGHCAAVATSPALWHRLDSEHNYQIGQGVCHSRGGHREGGIIWRAQ